MACDIRQRYHEPSVWKLSPVEEVAARFVGLLIPTGDFKTGNAGADSRKQRLLNGARNFQIVLYPFKLLLSFCFLQRSLDVFPDLARNRRSDESAHQQNQGVKAYRRLRD